MYSSSLDTSKMKTDKLILTSKTALTKKYGANITKILTALAALQAFDKKRSITTEIIYLDDAVQMKKYNVSPVTKADDSKQHKTAVDALYKLFTPDYIMLLGAQDVIPFIPLINPAKDNDDDDRTVPSDLPYACDAAHNTKAGNFVTITRVVGRLPDVPGGTDAAYLVSLINDVIKSVPSKAAPYLKYFAASAAEWQKSTEQSVNNMFGNITSLQLVPAKGPKWSKTDLKPMVHFYNCHGSPEDPCFYGQKGKNYPVSLSSDNLAGNITTATVVAAECCYGAQLYDLQKTGNLTLSIANNYLKNHALGFVGSSTIAYGPADGQGLADLVTQYFILNVLDGASLGRALLEARQKFLNDVGPTFDPYELKTLAQFYLLGDPSVQLVINTKTPPDPKGMEVMKTRINRRANLAAKGVALGSMIAVPKKVPANKPSKEVTAAIGELLKKNSFDEKKCTVGVYKNEKKKQPAGIKAFMPDVHFHVFSQQVQGKANLKPVKVLVVKESSGQILGYRTYISK